MSDLDKQVVEALGYRYFEYTDGLGNKGIHAYFADHQSIGRAYSPSTNWEQCGELIKEYKICVAPRDNGEGKEWGAFTLVIGEVPGKVLSGATPQEAVCRAVIAMKDGET